MDKITYIDLIRAVQSSNTIKIVGKIDTDLLEKEGIPSLYYSIPLIEKLILEIYKLIPESDVEHNEQGIMRTPDGILNINKNVLPDKTTEYIEEIFGESGIRNKLFHVVTNPKNIKVSFQKIDFLIMQLLSILNKKITEYNGFELNDIEFL